MFHFICSPCLVVVVVIVVVVVVGSPHTLTDSLVLCRWLCCTQQTGRRHYVSPLGLGLGLYA